MEKSRVFIGLAATLAFAIAPCITHSAEPHAGKPGTGAKQADRKQIDRGRYMMIVGSCNDCHTAGFAPSDGKVPEKDWLMGSGPLGYRGPWGTTYAPNLRVTAGRMTEDQWVKFSKELKSRPPMPWFNLNQWAESDLRALYQYIKHLGPVGEPAQAYLPPDKIPKPPYVQWPAPPK